VYPWFWSRDGRFLIYAVFGSHGSLDAIGVYSAADHTTRPLLDNQFDNEWAILSPDSKWIAYNSDESGQQEVYVAPYPSMSPRTRVSISGGRHPLWSPDGRELYYRTSASLAAVTERALSVNTKVIAVSVESAPGLKIGTPHELFEGPYFNSGHDWAITPDGRAFLFIRDKEGQNGPGEMNVVLNWFEELKRKAPVK
jgi:serine/threonine-protein kinase